MKELIQNIQNHIEDIPGLKYVDEDWGQLDYYSPNFPVQWPCVLIDVSAVDFSNIGRDFKKQPVQRQMASGVVSFKIANLKLTNTSAKAPQNQKNKGWSIFELIEELHKAVQGFCPIEDTGQLIRTQLRRQVRDDGVQQYMVTYAFERTNV